MPTDAEINAVAFYFIRDAGPAGPLELGLARDALLAAERARVVPLPPSIKAALRILADVHTKDDAVTGYTVIMGATPHDDYLGSISGYAEAWGVVRDYVREKRHDPCPGGLPCRPSHPCPYDRPQCAAVFLKRAEETGDVRRLDATTAQEVRDRKMLAYRASEFER